MSSGYTREEERALKAAVRAGRPPHCPRCQVAMDRHAVPPRPDVAYVRSRTWLRCSGCGGSLVVDLPH